MNNNQRRVLVTGGTGFVGGWTIAELLRRGEAVRTTVRDVSRAADIRSRLATAGLSATLDRLEVVAADLSSDDGWAGAVAGCSVVHHVATPFLNTTDEDAVIRPAVDGVLRVLRAARDAGVERVIYTSSCGAVYYGHPPRDTPFTENDWTVIDGGPMSAYVKSKALAERAAWDFMTSEGGDLTLTTICPSGIFGPALAGRAASSLALIDRLLKGAPPLVPDLRLVIVDVRDVVDLHLRAMDSSVAAGQRYIASASGAISMIEVAKELRRTLGPDAAKVPRLPAPDWLVRLAGHFNAELRDLVPLLGQQRTASADKAHRELGWNSRPWQETVVASVRSLLTSSVR